MGERELPPILLLETLLLCVQRGGGALAFRDVAERRDHDVFAAEADTLGEQYDVKFCFIWTPRDRFERTEIAEQDAFFDHVSRCAREPIKQCLSVQRCKFAAKQGGERLVGFEN